MERTTSNSGRSSGGLGRFPQYLYNDSDEAFQELFVKGTLPDRLQAEISMLKKIMEEITQRSRDGQRKEDSDDTHSINLGSTTKNTKDNDERTTENEQENETNNWKCKQCGLDNSNDNHECYTCHKPKAEQSKRITALTYEVENQKRQPRKSSENSSEVSEQSDNDESDGDNTPTKSSDKSKRGGSAIKKTHKLAEKSVNSKDPNKMPKSKKSLTGGLSKTDNSGESRTENSGKQHEKIKTDGKNARQSKKVADRPTNARSKDSGTAKQGSTTKITRRDGRNKQPIENNQENATNTWKCGNCTLDNPHNKYICDACGKSNDKQRDQIILEVDEVKDQRPGKLSEELLNKFETTPKNRRSESNDTDPDLYSEGEDPFEFLDNPGRKSYSDAVLTGGQFRGEFQNKQSHDRLGKTSNGVNNDKQSNKIQENKTANHWTCKHCTLDNSLDQYICASCGKTNDELRTTMGNKTGAVQKQKRRNLESNEDVMQYEDENRDRELKNVTQNATADGWSCEHCTMANPLDQYICNGCSRTNDQQRQNIVQEKEAVQKHYLQPTTPHKNYATELRVAYDQHDYDRYKDAGNLGRHGNSHALLAREQIEDDNAAAAGIETHNIDQQSTWFFKKPVKLFTKLIDYFTGKGIETEVERVIQLSQVPWDNQNDKIKKNYRNIVANGRMESKSQWTEMAAMLQFIYPEIDINIIIDSILKYDDIEKIINTILKHQKK